MSKFRFRLRILLLTLAIGIFGVAVYKRLNNYLNEIPVNLPHTQSESILIITTKTPQDMGGGGGGGK